MGFLAGRAGGAPDPDALAAGARPQDFRHDRIAKVIERSPVAKKEGLVGGHGLDHLGGDGGGSCLHLLHEVADAGEATAVSKRFSCTSRGKSDHNASAALPNKRSNS